MRKEEGRTVGLYFMVSPEEMALIKKKDGTGGHKEQTCLPAEDGG